MMKRFGFLALAGALVAGCVTETKVIKADLTKRQGVYVIAYVADADVRLRVEDQIVEDLAAQDVPARPSNDDINNILLSSRDEVLVHANKHALVGVLVINQVAADASDSVVADPRRVSPTHPDLRAFYANTPPLAGEGERIFVEINLFVLDEDEANLFWSGTAWSLADGKGSAAREISNLVAQQLGAIRQKYRLN